MEAILNGPFGRITLGPSNLTIGRTADNQLVISDAKTSSHHAEIRPNGQGYSIVDVGSTNGTFVNEQRVERSLSRPLTSGDTIRIGDTHFTYEVSGTGAAPTIYAQPFASNDPPYPPTVAAVPPTAYGPDAQPGYQGAYQQIPPAPYEQQPAQPFYAVPPPPPYAPPPLGQPGFPAYGQPMQAAPGLPAYAQPTVGKSRRGLWITLGVIGGVLLLVCVACGILAVVNAPTPAKTLDAFCNALINGDTHTAYTQFSNNLQSQLKEPVFTQAVSVDKVTSCTHGSPNESGSSARASLTLVHASGARNNDAVTLIKDSNSDWKIDSVQQQ